MNLTDLLLLGILIALLLNGDWPARSAGAASRQFRRTTHDLKRRFKNWRANRKKGRST